ncbi:hypothetical protein GCM10019017_23840 [Streptomyces showdoensis]
MPTTAIIVAIPMAIPSAESTTRTGRLRSPAEPTCRTSRGPRRAALRTLRRADREPDAEPGPAADGVPGADREPGADPDSCVAPDSGAARESAAGREPVAGVPRLIGP